MQRTELYKPWVRAIIAGFGCLCVALGVIGIFLPLLPTTPFLLLAAWLFSRSSQRYHEWLLKHPKLGPIISAWQEGKGIERKLRRKVIFLIWASLVVSMIIVAKLWLVVMLAVIGCSVTLYLMKQPVLEE